MQLGSRIWDALSTLAPIELFDSGLADALVVETYIHGSSPASYDSIYTHGVDPEYGTGGETGLLQAYHTKALQGADVRTIDRFFVFDHNAHLGSFLPSVVGYIAKNILVHQYAIMASVADQLQTSHSFMAQIKGFFLGLSTPTVQLRFLPGEARKIFENDEFFEPGFASYTEEKISIDHLGIRGTLTQGLKAGWTERVKQNPGTFLRGIAKMVASIALVVLVAMGACFSGMMLSLLLAYSAVRVLQVMARLLIPLWSHSDRVPHPRDRVAESAFVDAFTQAVDAPSDQPVAILFSGCSGSGKSYQRLQLMEGHERAYVLLDSDEILQKMPQYHALLGQGVANAASILHKDSLRLRTKIFKQAVNEHKSLIVEGTGSNLTLYKEMIKKLKSQNYRIRLIRCEVDLDEAKRRVRLREQQTARYVPEEAIAYAYHQSKKNLEKLKSMVDEYQLVNS